MKTRNTKKRFVLSLVAVIACVAMLVGTTMAWFTDSVTSGKNKIVAGNLDIELEYLDTSGDTPAWAPVTKETKLFNDDALWEPGYTEVAYLKLSNKGNLALKYNLGINISDEVSATNVAGDTFKLSDYIKMGVVESDSDSEITPYADRTEARAAVIDAGNIANYTKLGNMVKGADPVYMAVVVFMPEEVGNEANYRGTTPPSIDFGVSVVATQLTSERDSFDDQYDFAAPWVGDIAATVPYDVDAKTYTVSTGAELAKIAQIVNAGDNLNGKTVELAKDIDLNNVPWTPIGKPGASFNGIFNGKGKTILNLNVTDKAYAGLFGHCINHGTIQNVNINHATVTSNHYAGAVLAQGYANVNHCNVSNATITTNPEFVNGKWDNGDKAGAVIGQICEGSWVIDSNTATNVIVKGYRDIGGILGYANKGVTVSNNKVNGAKLINNREHNYKNYTQDNQFDVNDIVGEVATGASTSNNQATNVTKEIVPAN